LFVKEPPDDLIAVEDEPSGATHPKMRQALPKALLTDGPDGAPNESRDLSNRKRLAKYVIHDRVSRRFSLGHRFGQFCPRRNERNASSLNDFRIG
jgi:hypothetical protein